MFLNILEAPKEIQSEIRNWRNNSEVRKYMYNSHEISEHEHSNWLISLKQNQKNKVYLYYLKDKAIGIVSLNNIDFDNKKSDWAFYLNPSINSQGIGSLMEFDFLNFIFDNFSIEKLNCEVLAFNVTTIKLHKKFSFVEEGVRRKNILKNEERIDVYLLGLLKEEWEIKRNELQNKIEKIRERF